MRVPVFGRFETDLERERHQFLGHPILVPAHFLSRNADFYATLGGVVAILASFGPLTQEVRQSTGIDRGEQISWNPQTRPDRFLDQVLRFPATGWYTPRVVFVG